MIRNHFFNCIVYDFAFHHLFTLHLFIVYMSFGELSTVFCLTRFLMYDFSAFLIWHVVNSDHG